MKKKIIILIACILSAVLIFLGFLIYVLTKTFRSSIEVIGNSVIEQVGDEFVSKFADSGKEYVDNYISEAADILREELTAIENTSADAASKN